MKLKFWWILNYFERNYFQSHFKCSFASVCFHQTYDWHPQMLRQRCSGKPFLLHFKVNHGDSQSYCHSTAVKLKVNEKLFFCFYFQHFNGSLKKKTGNSMRADIFLDAFLLWRFIAFSWGGRSKKHHSKTFS